MRRTLALSVLIPLVALLPAAAGEKVTLCHCPLRNPDDCVTITVGARAAASHLANHPDDFEGVCPPKLLWQTPVSFGGSLYEWELSNDGRTLVLTSGFFSVNTVALATEDGAERWRSLGPMGLGEVSRMTISAGNVWTAAPCVIGADGWCVVPPRLYANDLLSGETVLWSSLVESPKDLIAHPDGSAVYNAGDELRVSAYNGDDGEVLWTNKRIPGLGFFSSITRSSDGDTLFAAGGVWQYPYDCEVRALDSVSGQTLWTRDIPPEQCDYRSTPKIEADRLGIQVYLLSISDYDSDEVLLTIQALDAVTGQTLWSVNPLPAHSLSGSLHQSADGNAVYLGGRYGVIAFDAFSGVELWRDESLEVNGMAATHRFLVVSGEETDNQGNKTFVLRGLHPGTGAAVWRIETEERPGSVLAGPWGRSLYLVTHGPNVPITEFTVNSYVVRGW